MAAAPLISGGRLEGKVAIITGGASGIGESMARLFTQHGAKVVIADVQDDLGRSVAEALGPTNCSYVHYDVTNEDQIKNAVDSTVAAHGRLDIMVNNAGVMGAYEPHVPEGSKTNFEHVMSVNATGAYLGIKHAARVMIPARAGCILSTASVAACVGGMGTHAYCASKHALVGITKNAAVELGQFGIRVNCVSPFGVATPLVTKNYGLDDETVESMSNARANLKGVTLKAHDVAYAALYLVSDEARYVSGVNLPVDGGYSIVNSAYSMFQNPES